MSTRKRHTGWAPARRAVASAGAAPAHGTPAAAVAAVPPPGPAARRLRLSLALAGLLVAAACATGPGVPPQDGPQAMPEPPPAAAGWRDEPPPGPDAGRGGPLAELPPLLQRLRLLALQEWQLWGQGRWHAATGVTEARTDAARRHEGEADFSTRVLAYWLSFRGADFAPERFRHADGSLLPWSAVFISWLMRSAGVPERQFMASESHWVYIRDALEAGPRTGFEPLDAATTVPQPGDLACAPRPSAAGSSALEPGTPATLAQWRALPRAQRQRGWPWHCDLVVQVGLPGSGAATDAAAATAAAAAAGTAGEAGAAGEIGAIGGNVSESVSWTRAPLTAQGLLLPTAERPWVLLLRHSSARDASAAARRTDP